MSFVPLHCGAQQYDWGKLGPSSKVAQYASASTGLTISSSTPYAELWMGTHPSLPSKVATTGESLKEYLGKNPKYLGGGLKDLPFLFKVLSIGKALSIQAHPDKTLGKKLHAEQPNIYKDPNHKPEMAIALTPFSAFCGFRPLSQISSFLQTVREFSSLAKHSKDNFISVASNTSSSAAEQKAALKELFGEIMSAPAQQFMPAIRWLVERLESEGVRVKEGEEPKTEEELVLRLNEQFPDDIGILCTFLLNWVHLKPGEAIFLKANEPHAYLSGDIIECMATSDSVIRAGLTPKLRDVPVLLSMLTYTTLPPASQLLSPTSPSFAKNGHSKLYDPPIDEFSVVAVTLRKGEEEKHDGVEGPSVIIVTAGGGEIKGQKTKEGDVWFVAAGEEVHFKAGEKLELYRAFVVGFKEDE
ncbi:mannose-6-phosphate isomerase [Atractiella rhizophila]|nr:mannose-6-phosphate isomerase [Atractiella rhizophila]